MPVSTVTSKGQITIPKQIRDQMGLKPGDRIDFVKDRTGSMTIKPITTDFLSMRGIVKSGRRRPMTIEEMDDAIQQGVLEENK